MYGLWSGYVNSKSIQCTLRIWCSFQSLLHLITVYAKKHVIKSSYINTIAALVVCSIYEFHNVFRSFNFITDKPVVWVN